VASGFEMRVGDAERDAAATELREHFASGRLTQDELNERLDQTFAAKTRGDLNGLFTDLPSATGQSTADGGARSTAGGPYGDSASYGRRFGERSIDWGAGYGDRTTSAGSDPFGASGAGGRGRPGGFARHLVVSFVLLSALLSVGVFAIFGIGGGRPFGIVLLLAAFALLRRLIFMIFGRRMGGRGGPRRGGRGGPRRRRR